MRPFDLELHQMDVKTSFWMMILMKRFTCNNPKNLLVKAVSILCVSLRNLSMAWSKLLESGTWSSKKLSLLWGLWITRLIIASISRSVEVSSLMTFLFMLLIIMLLIIIVHTLILFYYIKTFWLTCWLCLILIRSYCCFIGSFF